LWTNGTYRRSADEVSWRARAWKYPGRCGAGNSPASRLAGPHRPAPRSV